MTFVFAVKSPALWLVAAKRGDVIGVTPEADNTRYCVTVARPTVPQPRTGDDYRIVSTRVMLGALSTCAPSLHAFIRAGVLECHTYADWCAYLDGLSDVSIGATAAFGSITPSLVKRATARTTRTCR